MKFFKTHKSKFLITGLLFAVFLLVASCQNWMSNDNFMEKIESEVHDANASQITVYVRYAHDKMGKTEPSGNTTMKVDVASKLSAVTADDYGFVKWAAFSSADFATNKNHSDLTYISEEAYNSSFKKKEIPATEIEFSKPDEPITEVKIKKARADIFIIPIVAARPTYVQSVPAGGDIEVVKNTSIRILFSKAIDKETLVDSEGKLNYSISSSAATLIDDGDIVATDITDYFEASLSDSGKMLTLKLKEKIDPETGKSTGEIERLLDNRQRITITLFEGLCDTDGFAMNGNYTFNFTTGTSSDSLAPMIDVIFGGTGNKSDVFVSFHNGEIDGKATDAALNAPKNISSDEYTEELVAQRIYDKLNLYVAVSDIIASGNASINPAKDLSENNVNAIGIAASLYIDKDGNPVTAATLEGKDTSIAKKNYVYIPGTIHTESELEGLFTDYVPASYNNLYNLDGSIYTYDLSNLPDGLIKVDVWGIDMTGNSGETPGKAGAQYYTKHDNGYKSIFVVKDTTAPDSKTEAKKIKSNSAAAPYYWYNNSTLSTMELFDVDGNQIVDRGHAKLRSLAKNLSWNFVVGKSTTAPASTDSGWKLIHNQDTGASIKYTLDKAKAPESDGPIDITLYIRDDLGNVSEPVLLDSIMYDNTKPTVKLKKGKGDFVKANGQDDLHVSEPIVIDQILKVEIAETNENNAGSGIRRLEIHVKKDGQEVAVPLDAARFAVKYAPSTIANPTPSSEGIRDIAIAADDEATTANLKVFNVNDSNKITSGTLFIYGITLGDTDGTYDILVDLYDSALNKTPDTAETKMARDTTDPVITKVQVMDVASRKVYGQDVETWWLPYDRFEDKDNLSKVTLKITANEAGSGLKFLKLAENAEFTENTKLYAGDKLLTRDVDYKLNTSTKTIELIDWYTPKLINANNSSHVITLENIKLNNINVPAGAAQGQGNKIRLTVDDFVGKTKSENTITYGNTTTTGTLVYADSVAPQIATLTVEDSGYKNTNPDHKGYNKDNYTDSQTVILYLTLGDTEAGDKGSGVNKVILSDNAVFTAATEIFVVEGSTETKLATPADYAIDSDNKTVSFTKVFTETNKLKFTNVNLVSAVNGPQIIKADVQDFAGIKSAASKDTNNIIFDNVAPVVVQNAQRNDVSWITSQPGVTTGQEKDMTVDTQSLKIDFTEATAGVKVIKFEIHHDAQPKTNSYGKPFGNTNFAISYTSTEGTKPLVKGTDYEIRTNNTDTNIQQYIEFTKTYKSGSFVFDNLTLTNGNTQGNYVVDVLMLDAAENKVDCNKVITVDTVKPVITSTLSIEDLISSRELTTGSTPVLGASTGTFWLKKSYVGAVNDHAPTEIPVIITIKEEGSGIKVITFQEDAVISATNTKLWTVSGSTKTEFARSKYTIDEAEKKITITATSDCFKGASDFKLLVTGVGFAHTDTADEASVNTIKVVVSDVALWDSDPVGTPEQLIYSDSRTPDAPQSLTLKDRAYSAATKTINASAGYTNDEIVDMTFNLTDSEKSGSGYHKFVLSGATFIDDNSANKTTMTIKAGNTVISDAEFAISDGGKTLTLKKSGLAADVYAVIRQAVSVELKNVKLDNGNVDGSKTVTLTAYDLTGWNSTAASTSIILDTHVPELEKDVFAANYTTDYYKPAINVYPHANGEISSGVLINYGTESAPVNVPTFYTATTYKAGYYQVNGEVSSSSSAPAVTDFIHGAVLGIRAKDNIMLGGWIREKTFLYYYKYSGSETPFTKTEEEILAGTNDDEDINNKRNPAGNSATSTSLWFGFDEGKYSAVIVDEAGNVSTPFHFAVVRDVTKPSKTDLNERVLLQMPESSAKAYKNGSVVTSDDFYTSFKAYELTSSNPIRNKKYIIKKSDNGKYKIQLNLNGDYNSSAAEPVETINGSGTILNTEYADLTAKVDTTTNEGSSPIEKYAISTWYGLWPSTISSTYTYQPVVPYGTYFPSGQQHTGNSTALGKNYFEYTTNYSSYWRAENGNTNWHPYKYINSNTKYTDSGNGIVSYIDSKNNLVIEIPDDRKTAPISIFLQDGCGNINYVVCGLYQEGGKDIAVSFIVDKQLGYAETPNGYVTTPIILQNPYMTYVTSSPSVAWPSGSGNTGFYWNHNTGNGDQGGESARRGFIKDNVKYATYYNPYIWNNVVYQDDDSTKSSTYDEYLEEHKVKIGLTLGFDAVSGKRGSPEDILFADSLGKVTDPDPDSSTSGDYTCRALLYCTTSGEKPSYETIISSNLESNQVAGITGFRTEWVGVRTSNDDSKKVDETDENYATADYKISSTTILLDYPQPDYKTLGSSWKTNETSGEPKPYYIWYVFEDRVGNYEIGKIVNSNASGNQLTTTTSGMFDRWLYDNEAPKLTIRGSVTASNPEGTSPDTITAENIGQLVATNNGFVPYVDSDGNVYIHASNDFTSTRAGASQNTNVGTGTVHHIHGDSNKNSAVYNPFVDVEVSERTGIRAFAWTTSATPDFDFPTSSDDYGYSSSWYSSISKNYWYTSYATMSSITKDIGVSISYDGYPELAYYYDSSNYTSSIYSGVKVCTVIPYGKISTATELWLHVMDWTGNISHYRMGASGVKFINDSTAPSYTTSAAEKLEPGQYYLKKTGSGNPELKIAGAGDKAKNQEAIDVYIPEEYFTESGSGIKGYSFNNDGTGIAERIGGKLYLSIPYSKYHGLTSDTYYVYDNVGNVKAHSLTYDFDDQPPKIASVAFVSKLDSSDQGKFADAEDGLGEQGGATAFGAARFYTHKDKNSNNVEINKYHADVSHFAPGEVQEIYISKENAVKFQVNFDTEIKTEIAAGREYLDDIKINRWDSTAGDAGEWETLTSWKSDRDDWWLGAGETESSTVIRAMGTSDNSGYDTLTYTTEGTYYQILATDISGNASCQYFKLILDKDAPTFDGQPSIEVTKGSINAKGSDTAKVYYYTADSTHKLKIKFKVVDSGVGSKNLMKAFKYSLNGSKWTTIDNPDNVVVEVEELAADETIEYGYQIKTGYVDTLYLQDIFGNITETSASILRPGFNYTYKNADNEDTTETIPKLTYRSPTETVAAPSISAGTKTHTYHNNQTHQNVTDTYDIVNQIETLGIGLDENNNFTVSTEEIWSKLYTEKLTGSNTVLIKDDDEAPRTKLRITLPAPSDSNLIIGYLRRDDSGITTSDYTAELYSFKNLDYVFTENLPLAGEDDHSAVTLKYYAVDVVGNISATPLTVIYSYDNPHKAKDVILIENPLTSEKIPNDVKQAMQNDNLTFSKFYTIAGGPKGKKDGLRFFGSNYLVIRCSLLSKDEDYLDRPVSVGLYDVWIENGKQKSGLRGESDNNSYKIYFSSNPDQVGGTGDDKNRYYCYIAFKAASGFNNNDTYDGSVLYFKVKGNTTSSDYWLMYRDNDTDATKKYGWKLDSKSPKISGNNAANSNKPLLDGNRLINYTINKTLAQSYDNAIGPAYVSVTYSSGTKIRIPTDNITDEKENNLSMSGVGEYKFDIVEGDTDTVVTPGTWTTASIPQNKNYYELELPVITSVHRGLRLYVRDRAGNVSTAVYQLAYPSEKNQIWWISDNILPTDGTGVTWTDAEWTEAADDYTFKVDLPEGSIIKKVSVKVDGQEKDSSNANWGTVKFNGYKSDLGQFPTLNGNDGWIIVNRVTELGETLQGLDITVKKITQDWANHNIEIKINDNENLKKTYTNFVTPKSFTASDVDISDADENGVVTLSSNTDAPLETYVTAVSAKVNGIAIGATLSENNTKVTLSGIPEKTWSAQEITLTVNPDGINKSKVVKTIAAIADSDISVGTATKIENTNTYEIPVTYSNGAPTSVITTVTSTAGTVAFAKKADGTTDDTTKILLTGVHKTWDTLTIGVTISDGGEHSITNDNVLSFDAIGKNDIHLTGDTSYNEGTTEYNITISIDGGETPSNIEVTGATLSIPDASHPEAIKLTIAKGWDPVTVTLTVHGIALDDLFEVPALVAGDFTVSGPESYTSDGNYEYTITRTGLTIPAAKVTAEGATVTWDETNQKATFAVTQGWSEQTITLKVNNLTVKTLSVGAKTIQASDVGIEIYDVDNNKITAYPTGEGVNPPYYLKIKVTVPGGVTITKVTSGETELQSAGESSYGLNGNPIPNTAKITVVTSNGTVSDIELFPTAPQGNENRISTAPITLSGGLSDVSKWNYASDSGETGTNSGIMSFITGLFSKNEVETSNATDVSQDKAKKKSAKSAKKQTKASKKAQKALDAATDSAAVVQEIEQIATQAVTVEPVVIDQAADVAVQATVEKPEAVKAEVPAIEVSAALPEVGMDTAAPSKAALWIILCAFLISVAGVVFFIRKRKINR